MQCFSHGHSQTVVAKIVNFFAKNHKIGAALNLQIQLLQNAYQKIEKKIKMRPNTQVIAVTFKAEKGNFV